MFTILSSWKALNKIVWSHVQKRSACLPSLSHLDFVALYGASNLLSLLAWKWRVLSLHCPPLSLPAPVDAAGGGGHLTCITRARGRCSLYGPSPTRTIFFLFFALPLIFMLLLLTAAVLIFSKTIPSINHKLTTSLLPSCCTVRSFWNSSVIFRWFCSK